MAQMDINEAVLQVERMCKYSKDSAALEAIRAFIAEVQNSSHNRQRDEIKPDCGNCMFAGDCTYYGFSSDSCGYVARI